jgi:hypothetical protein
MLPPRPETLTISRMSQTIPFGASKQWGSSVANRIDSFLTGTEQDDPRRTKAAMNELLDLPQLILDVHTRGSAHQARVRLQRLVVGEALEVAEDPARPEQRTTQHARPHRPVQYWRAQHMHHHLFMDCISPAACCLEEQSPLDFSDEVLYRLQALHPSEHLPPVPVPTIPAFAITDEIPGKVLKALPQGSKPGPSGWTYEEIKAANASCEDARGAVLRILRAIVQRDLPHLPRLLPFHLLLIPKPSGDLQPIAISEAW